MVFAFVAAVLIVIALIVFMLCVVILGMRQEPGNVELSSRPPNLLALIVRRLLGVHVRKPDDEAEQHDPCMAGHGHAAGHDEDNA